MQPEFTNSFGLGFKNGWNTGYFYGATYHRISTGTITSTATTVDTSNLIYNLSQNAGKSDNTGIEIVISQDLSDKVNMNLNINGYNNLIDAFTVVNRYPIENTFTAEKPGIYTGNIKLKTNLKFAHAIEAQLTAIYLAPDIIPQGTIDAKFSLDLGVRKMIQDGKGELFLNATDLQNTMIIRKKIKGNNFTYTSRDFYETQVIRFGYSYKF
ncbi:MAG: hypothetical protein ACI9XJ_001893 [Marivirga sp.]